MTSSTVPTEASKNGLSCCSMTPCWPTRPAMDRLLHHAHVIEVTRAPTPRLSKRELRGKPADARWLNSAELAARVTGPEFDVMSRLEPRGQFGELVSANP